MNSYYRNKIAFKPNDNPKKIFLAEGDSEVHFLTKIFTTKGFNSNDYAIFCFKGIDNLQVTFKALDGYEIFYQAQSIGIIIDADDDPQRRLQSTSQILKNFNLIDRNAPFEDGRIFIYNNMRIGLFISPGKSRIGCIETMIQEEIKTKPEFECFQMCEKCLTEKYNYSLSSKFIAQIYISLKKPRLCGAGRGFESNIFNIEHEAYKEAVDFLVSL